MSLNCTTHQCTWVFESLNIFMITHSEDGIAIVCCTFIGVKYLQFFEVAIHNQPWLCQYMSTHIEWISLFSNFIQNSLCIFQEVFRWPELYERFTIMIVFSLTLKFIISPTSIWHAHDTPLLKPVCPELVIHFYRDTELVSLSKQSLFCTGLFLYPLHYIINPLHYSVWILPIDCSLRDWPQMLWTVESDKVSFLKTSSITTDFILGIDSVTGNLQTSLYNLIHLMHQVLKFWWIIMCILICTSGDQNVKPRGKQILLQNTGLVGISLVVSWMAGL